MSNVILPWLRPRDAVSAAIDDVSISDLWMTLLPLFSSRPYIMDNDGDYRSMIRLLDSMQKILKEYQTYTSAKPAPVQKLAKQADAFKPIIRRAVCWNWDDSITEPHSMYACFNCLKGIVYMYRKDGLIVRPVIYKLLKVMHHIYKCEETSRCYPSALKDLIHLSPAVKPKYILTILADWHNDICTFVEYLDDSIKADLIEPLERRDMFQLLKVPIIWDFLLSPKYEDYFLPVCAMLLVHPGTPKEILNAISEADISQYSIIKDIAKLRAGKTGNMKDRKLEPLYDIKAMF